MIELLCGCAAPPRVPESAVGKRVRCPGCSRTIQIVSAEALAEGHGAGDFDAGLTIVAGPADVGVRFLLGGVADIQVGKLPDRHIVLQGNRVSRGHCFLSRVDFGPSRWRIVDNDSTNGLVANGHRIAERELQDGDLITIGEYQLEFRRTPDARMAAGAIVASAYEQQAQQLFGPPCPSCEQVLPQDAKSASTAGSTSIRAARC